ncbi:MAG: dTMP kinase [Elusimicrobiota bacterium]
MKSKKGIFITFEGTDGAGKTTHVQLLSDWLQTLGLSTTLTREPGGGFLAEQIREILLNPETKMHSLTELFLYEAARAEHVEKVIKPGLAEGKIVICDRFTDATIAYQGFARKLSIPIIKNLNKIATQNIKPDLTLFLNVSPKTSLTKALNRSKNSPDRLEKEGVSFQEKVWNGYQYLAKSDPKRFKKINLQPAIEETQKLIRTEVLKKIYGSHWSKHRHSISL